MTPTAYYTSTGLLARLWLHRDPTALLSDLERSKAWQIGIVPGMVKGPPKAIVVGEMPGASESPWRPLWPDTKGRNRGARLASLVGHASLAEYLSTWFRVNLIPEWNPFATDDDFETAARGFVDRLHALCRACDAIEVDRPRVVVLGERLSTIFGGRFLFDEWVIGLDAPAGVAEICSIPHTSHRNLLYRSAANRSKARNHLRWAARL